ncbi:MAG: hypothetical protein HY052_04030 [Proteobacteria bacterium]|nr:hypothetical protein [Pseudomonadota bacterium]
MDSKKIDWVVLKRYASSQAIRDLDRFLDAVPMTVGYNALIAASFAWLLAGSALFFTSIETGKVTKMHADLMQIQALRPPIPVLKSVPVNASALKALATKIAALYKGVLLTESEGGVVITAQDTDYFPQFISAISYLQRGGKNWKVQIETLCVGSACTGAKLAAKLKVESVRISEPEAEAPKGTKEKQK